MAKVLICKLRPNIVHPPFVIIKRFNVTGHKKTDEILVNVTGGRINTWLQQFNDVFGYSDVKEAQDKVLDAEKAFQLKQEERRERAKKLGDLQSDLHLITKEREMASKGTQLFLNLVTKENDIIKAENELKSEIRNLEEEERTAFSKMSAALRSSQEIERSQARQTQHIGWMMSLAGVILGGIVSFLVNHFRTKKIVSSFKDSLDECKRVTSVLHEHVQNQEVKMSELIKLNHRFLGAGVVQVENDKNVDNKKQIDHHAHSIDKCTKEILEKVKNQEVVLDKEISSLKKMIGSSGASSDSIVYIGPEVKDMLDETEKSLEWKMKVTALASATLTYGAVIITVPVLYILFKSFGNS